MGLRNMVNASLTICADTEAIPETVRGVSMVRLATISLAAACAVGFCHGASAADLAPEITLAEAGPVSAGTGPYLRADLGFAGWTADEDAGLVDGAGTYRGFDEGRFSHPVSYGVGIGYQVTDVLRADVTVDTFKDRFGAEGSCGVACTASYGADYRGIGVMANGYVDLATIAGFTPYLGAGLGATRLKWSDAEATYTCGAVNCGGESFDGNADWRFTYALMAGVSYALTDRVKLDLGYRYSDMAGGDMFRAGAARGEDDGFARHEFRAGVRVALW